MDNCNNEQRTSLLLCSKQKSAYSMKSTSSWPDRKFKYIQPANSGLVINEKKSGTKSIRRRMGQESIPKMPFDNIDINSINVRKFNLDICEDQNQDAPSAGSEIKRVCLPIFAYDILKSMNDLDINSSASKSLGCNLNQTGSSTQIQL